MAYLNGQANVEGSDNVKLRMVFSDSSTSDHQLQELQQAAELCGAKFYNEDDAEFQLSIIIKMKQRKLQDADSKDQFKFVLVSDFVLNNTDMHTACQTLSMDTIQDLIEKNGIDACKAVNHYGDTPIHLFYQVKPSFEQINTLFNSGAVDSIKDDHPDLFDKMSSLRSNLLNEEIIAAATAGGCCAMRRGRVTFIGKFLLH